MYLLFSRMRRDAEVALTGEAADEMFAGTRTTSSPT